VKEDREFHYWVGFDRKAHFVQPAPKHKVLCYAVHTPGLPAKVDAKKAKELGVTFGPDIGKLSRGEEVTLANGKTVKLEDCCASPASNGPVRVAVPCLFDVWTYTT
jgi:ribonuclease BN (tRNA processing enzyme)